MRMSLGFRRSTANGFETHFLSLLSVPSMIFELKHAQWFASEDLVETHLMRKQIYVRPRVRFFIVCRIPVGKAQAHLSATVNRKYS
jgi:hypothetical protein